MKRKGLLKRNLAFLLTAVMAVGIVSLGPNNATEVRAEGTTTKTLGTSGIKNPSAPTENGWSGSYVYFGKYKYRVLANNTSAFGGTTMLLDCDTVLEARVFDSRSNVWASSDIKKYFNSEGDYSANGFLTSSFSELEQATIAESATSESQEKTYDYLKYVNLTNEKIFILDAKEATNSSYGYSNDNSRKKTGNDYGWWLRSPYTNIDIYAGGVDSGGSVSLYSVDNGNVGVSPALNIDLSSVLFSSEISANSGEYKLTLIDETGLKIALNGNVNKSVDSTNGDTLKIPYALSGDDITNSTKVSVFITNGKYEAKNPNGATIVTYGTLQGDSRKDNTGEGTFNLTTEVSNNLSNYHVYIVAENINGEKETDYASVPIEIVFAANEPTTNTTDDSNSNDTSTSTETATTETTEVAPITITYTVKKDDYMRKIAREHGITLEQLIALNPQVKNPNLIYAGQVLVISTTGSTYATTEITATKTYTVQRGDSLYKIARKNGITLAELKSLNENLFAQKYIFAGQQVLLK